MSVSRPCPFDGFECLQGMGGSAEMRGSIARRNGMQMNELERVLESMVKWRTNYVLPVLRIFYVIWVYIVQI
jgi:hypothetical protein